MREQVTGKREQETGAKNLVAAFLTAILLFPLPCSLFPAATAAGISSDKIDTFMHLPDWFPTSVDAEHTFGSDEHTNCTHRTTIDTLAAVESVFDAYHERVFYASEGRSNDWNVALYGPRPTDLQSLWFTNAASSSSTCFIYSTWTNTWPRATPDSRRLVEFDNLFAMSMWIPSLFSRRRGAPWLDKGDTWGRERNIMFGSSWGPAAADFPEIGWTENGSFRPDLAASCVPLCYCMTDTVFNVSSPSEDGFLWDVLRGLDANFNALYRIEGGPLPQYAVRTNGYLAEWHNSGAWTNSTAAKTSVPGIITNAFPFAGPEFAMTNHTRRLVPDDYVRIIVTNMVLVSSNEYHASYADVVDISNVSTADVGGYPLATHADTTTIDHEVSERHDGDLRILSVSCVPHFHNDSGYDFTPPVTGNLFDGIIIQEGVSEYDVEFNQSSARLNYSIRRLVYLNYEWFAAWEDGGDPTLHVRCYKYDIVTNRVSSLLATESRALAMLDRTYEIPKCIVQTNINETASARDTERRFKSSLVAEGSSDVEIKLEYPLTPLSEHIMLDDLLSGSTPVIEYATTNLYSPILHPTVVERRMSIRKLGADGGISVHPPEGTMPVAWYTAGDLKEYLAYYYKNIQGAWGITWKIIRLSAYDNGWGDGVVTFFVVNSGERSDYLHIYRLRDLVPDDPISLTVAGSVRINRTASAFIGGVPNQAAFDRMYPWYGPGPYCYLGNVVDRSVVLFAEEVLAFKGVDRGGYVEWTDAPIQIPLRSTQYEIDTRPFTWRSWHMISVSQPSVGIGSGLSARVYDETYNALRSKVDAEFRAEVGDYSSASSVIPVSLDMAHFGDVSLTGLRLGLAGSSVTNEMEFVVNGQLPSDVSLRFTGGQELPDGVNLLSFKLNVMGVVTGDVRSNYEYEGPPVAIDGRLSPVIVTDWNWKALKTERNNK